MARDDTDTCITVPSFFRCPISLDVMRSPVTLCTGVTYDRASIQQWLDGGHNTCPATMQVLRTAELVPNRTLQRLIEVWSESVNRRRVRPTPDVAPSREEIDQMIEKLKIENKEESRSEMMSRIVRFARDSTENREFLVRKPHFLAMIVDLLSNAVGKIAMNPRIETVEQAIKILDAIMKCRCIDQKRLSVLMLMSGHDCLSAILLLLRRGNLESKIESVRVLRSIAMDAETNLLISARDGLVTELIKSISTKNDTSLIEGSLSCLLAISASKSLRPALIRAKSIKQLKNLLQTDASNSSVSITEKTLKLLETLSSCREGRWEMCGDEDCIQSIVKKLLKVSAASTEHAVTILWRLCCLFREQRVREAVTKSNGVAKILVLMQTNCSAGVRLMTKDLIKVLKIDSKSCLNGYDTKTIHIMPF